MNSLRHFPLGAPHPQSPHAVVSSLPTMADVRGYEEKDPRVVAAMASGYPRFVVHRFIRDLIDYYLQREVLADCSAVLLPSHRAAQALCDYAGPDVTLLEVEKSGVCLVYYSAEDTELGHRAGQYVQHVGCSISSRQAEDLLVGYGLLERCHEEAVFSGDSQIEVEARLAEQIGCEESDLMICASGMNAFYAGFSAVRELQRGRGRTRWLQLGWLYLDTGCILKEFLSEEESLDYCYDVFDIESVIEQIRSYGDELAAVVVECPTNPLVQVCEIHRVADAVREQGGIMIVDPTIGSVYNMDVLPCADVLVTSLTKYAATEGDVMIGALAVNSKSLHYDGLIGLVSGFSQSPYRRDLSRLALEIQEAPQLVEKMNANAVRLSDYLRKHPAVEQVYCARASAHIEEVVKREGSFGSVVSIKLRGSMEKFYDSIGTMKGPSFGTRFTLLCPFMYLAHYDLVASSDGRKFLGSVGIDPELIRISVGVEPYGAIEAVFEAALQVSLS